jgi:hypothetical protein
MINLKKKPKMAVRRRVSTKNIPLDRHQIRILNDINDVYINRIGYPIEPPPNFSLFFLPYGLMNRINDYDMLTLYRLINNTNGATYLQEMFGLQRVGQIICEKFGINKSRYSDIELYDLAFLLSKFILKPIHSFDNISRIANLDIDTRRKYITVDHVSNTSFLFTLITGFNGGIYANCEKINNVVSMQGNQLEYISSLRYMTLSIPEDLDKSMAGPMTILSITRKTHMEKYINKLDEFTVDKIIKKLEIRTFAETYEDKCDYICRGAYSLNLMLKSRDENPNLQPLLLSSETLIDKSEMEKENYLLQFSDKVLIKNYGLPFAATWNSRIELVHIIEKIESSNRAPWHWRSSRPRNNDQYSNLTDELRSEIDKERVLTIAYGTLQDYDCYQIEELILSTVIISSLDINTIVVYKPNSDPLEPFSQQDVCKLKVMLIPNMLPQNFSYSNKELCRILYNKLPVINMYNMNSSSLATLKSDFVSKSEKKKNKIVLYLTWLFAYANWMRFWKGPSDKLPISREDMNSLSMTEKNIMRAVHLKIQGAVRTRVLNCIGSNLEKEVLTYPELYSTNEVILSRNQAINIKLMEALIGEGCSGLASDSILDTSYFLIKLLLDRDPLAVLKENWVRLERLERRVVRSCLKSSLMRNDELKYYKLRYSSLKKHDTIVDTDFKFELRDKTVHTGSYGINDDGTPIEDET